MRKLVLSTAVIAFLSTLPSLALAQGTDLTPPPPMQPGATPPPRNDTEADLQKGEKDDSGLGLEWVYLNAHGGYSYMDLKGFSSSALALTTTTYSGGAYGFAAGVRLLFLTLGLRATNHTALNLWQINADIGMHMRVSRLDGYLAIRGGYDTVGSLNGAVATGANGGTPVPNSGVDVHGWNAGLAFGIDYYFAHIISLGAEAAGDILFLSRPVPPLPASVSSLPAADQNAIKSQPLYQNSGSSVGFGGTLTAHLAIHF